MRVDVHRQRHRHHAGLRIVLELQQRLFVVGGPAVVRQVGAVLVPDVGIQVDVGAGGAGDYQAGQADPTGGAHQSARQPGEPGGIAGLGPPPPQAVGQHHQDGGYAAGVEPHGPGLDPELAHAVHVRHPHAERPEDGIEHVLEAHPLHDDGQHQPDHHHVPADEFVGAEHLDEHRQDADQDEVGGVRQHVPEQILLRLEIEVALGRLHGHRRQHAAHQRGDQHQADGQHLGQHEGPIGRRGGVDDLVHPPVAVAPHHLAGEVGGDDHREDQEAALQGRQDDPRHRPQGAAVDTVVGDEPGVAAADGDAQAQDHPEHDALEHQRHVEAGAGGQLAPARPGRGLAHGGHRPRGLRRRFLLERLAGRAGRAALVERIGDGQRRRAQQDRQQPAPAQHAHQRRQQGVAVRHRPVAGDQTHGREAERLPPGHDRLQLGLAKGAGGHRVADDEHHHPDEGPAHRPGHRRQGEEDRAAHE